MLIPWGSKTAQGLLLTEAFYWDMNDETRAWSHRYFDKMEEKCRTWDSANAFGAYSSTLHYLQAVKAAGTVEASAVMKMMKATPINDFFAHDGRIQRGWPHGDCHDMYLFEVKKPSEIQGQRLGRLQTRRDHPGRGSLPAAVAIDLSAGEEIAVVTNRPFCVKSARRMSAISNHSSPDASARERVLYERPTRAP